MSLTLVPGAVEAYAEAHTTPPTAHLAELARATRETMSSPQMLTGAIEGRLLETLVFLARPRLVLEIGTYSGYGALSMAGALPEGARLVTCEVDDERADMAERHIAAAGLDDRVEVRRGPAIDTIAALDGPLDLVFVDADKTAYHDYYEAVLPKLSDHGLIAVDNVLWSGRVAEEASAEDSGSTLALRAFNDHVAADERTVSVMLTVRDGLTLIRRA
ncbi:MAG: class I SAM-dependent methyltransferase [Solirubrobacterales bacterium]|nr:class I SAM-dependent methyltransferase [Solirubrobacterales bacterium]